MRASAVQARGEDGQDGKDVLGKGFLHALFFGVIQNRDNDPKLLANKEDKFAAKAQQAVLEGEDQFADRSGQEQREQLFQSWFVAVQSAADVFDDYDRSLRGVAGEAIRLPRQILLL